MFHSLRKHRRQFGAVALAVLVAWLSVALVDCVRSGGELPHAIALATAADIHAAMDMEAVECPPEVCDLLQSAQRQPAKDQPAALTIQQEALATAANVAVALLPVAAARDAPPPANSRLPGRSPTLRFYGLRI